MTFWAIIGVLVHIVVYSNAQIGSERRLPDDVIGPPYYLLSVRAESYILPILPYELDELEPYIDRVTVEAHFEGHHELYRRRMNSLLNSWREDEPRNTLTTQPIVNIMRQLDSIPEKFRTKFRNHMGGFVNHCIYWACLSPNKNGTDRYPENELFAELEGTWGNYLAFKMAFGTAALDLFGSGYVWLVRDPKAPKGKQLSIMSTQSQDSPLSSGLNPLLVIDVWEHAYYLKHKFYRMDYINNWWVLVDWDNVLKLDQFWQKVASVNFDREEL